MPLQPLPPQEEVESKSVLKKVARAHRALAELKGILSGIPNQGILLETLTLREARESSAIENIISTFHDVYRSNMYLNQYTSPAAKEVHQYAAALRRGFELVSRHHLLTLNHILEIQAVVEQHRGGLRKLPETRLINNRTGSVVFTPPQDYEQILGLMNNLETFINDDQVMEADPLVKMAVIHHQFESIHPFYDGNGRTGRIINILYLVQKGLLHLPVLYMSSYIIRNKGDYYRLLQEVRETGKWESWIIFMLDAVEITAQESVLLIQGIRDLMQRYKSLIRSSYPKIYSQDLLNNLFRYPYTKIEFLQTDLGISRSTAIRYLNTLMDAGILTKHKIGRDNFFLNEQLFSLLSKNE